MENISCLTKAFRCKPKKLPSFWYCKVSSLIKVWRHCFNAVFKPFDYDAGIFTEEKVLADCFEGCVKILDCPKAFCNWITNDLLREVKGRKLDINNLLSKPKYLAPLAGQVMKETKCLPNPKIVDEMLVKKVGV